MASASAGGMFLIGSSRRRLLNQSTHSSVAYSTASKLGSDSKLVHFPVYAGARSRALNRSMLARPYIWRLRVFSRLICPSVCPFDQGSRRAAATAAQSLRRPRAKEAIMLSAASSSQLAKTSSRPFRTIFPDENQVLLDALELLSDHVHQPIHLNASTVPRLTTSSNGLLIATFYSL